MSYSNSGISQLISRRAFVLGAASAATQFAPGFRLTHAASATAASPDAGVFFDPTVVHDISAEFDQDTYDAMIQAFADTGEKQWIEANLTIDGQSFERAGLRLKGNSSLGGLRSTMGRPDGNAQDALPAMMPVDPNGTPTTGDGDIVTATMGGPDSGISADKPERLPWLIRLDKFVEGQNLNGLYEFVIRSNGSETALNEALALDLLTEAGLASQAAAYTRFSVNASQPQLRLAIENPDDIWLEKHFSPYGTLFKSEAEGNWSYRDENWESYVDAFDLEAGGGDVDAENYAPLISFLDFVNNSDDATFDTELGTRLDIEQFAVYMAMMDLIQNFDDIDGPGNNSYLYYDPESSSFTIVPWDMNLAFGGLGMGAPIFFDGLDGENGIGPGTGPGQLIVIDGTPSAGEVVPVRPDVTFDEAGPQAMGPGGFGMLHHPLTERWAAADEFIALQLDAHDRLRAELFEQGTAAAILARWVTVLETHATDLVDQATIDSESQRLQEQLDAA